MYNTIYFTQSRPHCHELVKVVVFEHAAALNHPFSFHLLAHGLSSSQANANAVC